MSLIWLKLSGQRGDYTQAPFQAATMHTGREIISVAEPLPTAKCEETSTSAQDDGLQSIVSATTTTATSSGAYMELSSDHTKDQPTSTSIGNLLTRDRGPPSEPFHEEGALATPTPTTTSSTCMELSSNMEDQPISPSSLGVQR